jgi:hypothetical protein
MKIDDKKLFLSGLAATATMLIATLILGYDQKKVDERIGKIKESISKIFGKSKGSE